MAQEAEVPARDSTDSETGAETPAPEQPAPHSLAEIPDQIEAYRATRRRILRHLNDRSAIDAIEEQIAPTESELKPILEKTLSGAVDEIEISELMNLDSTAITNEKALDSAIDLLQDATKNFEADLDNLAVLSEYWQRTETFAEDSSAPSELLDEIQTIHQGIQELTGSVTERRNEVVAVLTRVSELKTNVATFRAKASDYRRQARKRALTQEGAPIWKLRLARKGESLYHHFWIQLEADFAHLLSYFRDNAGRLILTFLAPLIAFLVFSQRLRSPVNNLTQDDPKAALASRVIQPAWPISLILSLLICLWLSPTAPSIYYRLLFFLIVVPAAALVRQTLGRRFTRSILALAVALAIQPFLTYIELSPLLDRLALIAQCIVVGLAFAADQRKGVWGSTLSDRWAAIAKKLIKLTITLLAFAILAAVFGEIGWARILRSGVLGSFGFGLLFLAIFRALDSLADVAIRTDAAKSVTVLRNHPRLALRFVRRLLATITLVSWVAACLYSFDIYPESVEAIRGFLNFNLGMGTFRISIGEVLAFVLTILGSMLLARIVCLLLDEEFLPRLELKRGLDYAITTMARYIILLVGFSMALFAAGLDLSKATLLAGAFGVGIGFGLQNIVNNFVSGLILLFERPIQVGDAIELDTVLGEVTSIGIRASTVRTFQGAEIIVPNGDLISKQVVNWTLSNRQRRVEIEVGVAYGTDPQKVLALLLEMAHAHPRVDRNPGPTALFTGFGDSSLNFQLRCWVTLFEEGLRVGSDLRVQIDEALKSEGITIPFPQRDLHIKSDVTTSSAAEKSSDSGLLEAESGEKGSSKE
jgi:small-conductance mechanosensitive channel